VYLVLCYVELVTRLDSGSFNALPRTTQGGVIIPAALTRVGVLTYYNPDGTKTREFRSPEEVFKADSLASLRACPVVALDAPRPPPHNPWHPPEINPDNFATYTKGVVEDVGRQDGDYVAANVRVMDSKTMKRVEGKNLSEVSAGYKCRLDATPGVWQGPNGPEPYDLRQVDIQYNHIALLPKGAGRAGGDVKLRLDAKGHQVADESGEVPLLSGDPTIHTRKDSDMTPEQIKALQDELAAAKALAATETKRADAAETKLAAVPRADAAEALGAQVELLKGQVSELRTKLDAASDPKAIDKLVGARVSLLTEARLHLDSKDKPFSADGMTDHQVRVAVLAKLAPSFKVDGKSEAAVEGAYTLALENSGTARAAFGKVQASTPAGRQDAKTPGAEANSAYTRNIEASVKAHEAPTPGRISAKH
jgi:hypothetical protein